ncbi:MAG: hypothetical protein E7578_07265 [Ruminococcaceae bacterium]|nr:hypothetical protein [Oscillospiraceae bacterium]
MPRLNASERDKKIARIEGLIKTGLSQQRLTYGDFCERMGFSKTRLTTIRRDPWAMELREIVKAARILGLTEYDFLSILMDIPKKEKTPAEAGVRHRYTVGA